MIGPHFTLVFGAPPSTAEELRGAAALPSRQRPFWFTVERIVRSDLYLVPSRPDGAAELIGAARGA